MHATHLRRFDAIKLRKNCRGMFAKCFAELVGVLRTLWAHLGPDVGVVQSHPKGALLVKDLRIQRANQG